MDLQGIAAAADVGLHQKGGNMSKTRFHKKTEHIRKRALELGYSAQLTANSHIKYTHLLVTKPIFGSSTPTDYRGGINCIKQLERALRSIYNSANSSAQDDQSQALENSSLTPARALRRI